MADNETTAPSPPASAPVEPVDHAGGGASEKKRSVGTVNEAVLGHLKRIFECYASKDQKWGPEQTKTFLSHVQEQEATSVLAQGLLGKEELGFNDFLEYMTSSSSSIAEPAEKEDLSWPLASYFISSSHNTYLSGNQLSSASSTETYTDVLRRGCRCVEIDVWDGDESDNESSHGSKANDGGKDSTESSTAETDKKSKRRSTYGLLKEKLPRRLSMRIDKTALGKRLEERQAKKVGAAAITGNKEGSASGIVEPRVLHGHTLTKEISFRAVCVAIRDSAFVTTDLPVIISFEVHCNPQQQGIMVDIMKEIWKDFLLPETDVDATELPSPEDLRKKILVKVKYVGPEAPLSHEGSGEDDDAPPDTRKRKKPSKIIQELSRLGIYTKAVSFKAFTQPEASMATHVFSLSEKKFLDHHESYGDALIEHNRHFLMRAYPSGLRIRSSNLNPAVFWGAGTQMVALNWQQTDEGTMLNEGMFAGSHGYVLKPEGYRPQLKGKTSSNTMIRKTLNLTLTFLAAQSIPLPAGDKSARGFHPYIKVELHVDACTSHPHSSGNGNGDKKTKAAASATAANGSHEDKDKDKEIEHKRRTRDFSGRDIDCKEEKVEFKDFRGVVDKLTFLRFTLRDDEIGRDELAAWACVRLDRLGNGYRFLHLMDSRGRVTDGVILVKVEKNLT